MNVEKITETENPANMLTKSIHFNDIQIVFGID